MANLEHRFEKPLPIVPTALYGFHAIQARAGNAPRVALSLSSLSENGFTLSLKSFLHQTSNTEAKVLVLPNGKTPFQHDFVDASDHPGGRAPRQNATIKVNFEKPFKTPPKICAWFTKLFIPNGHRSIWIWIENITSDGMTIHIDTWSDRELDAARVAWLAWPAEFDGKTVRANHDSVFSRNDGVADHPWYPRELQQRPQGIWCYQPH